MSGSRLASAAATIPGEDCACPRGSMPPVNMDHVVVLLGCGGCGQFALPVTGDLDDVISVLRRMSDQRTAGLPVVHTGGQG